jgi:hypothetical protein
MQTGGAMILVEDAQTFQIFQATSLELVKGSFTWYVLPQDAV